MVVEKFGFGKNDVDFTSPIPALTSLRFFSAFYVILYHVRIYSNVEMYWLNSFIESGYLAVDFFFILSGFILSYTYFPKIRNNKFSFKKFVIRRIARIYPVHIFMLICSLLLLVLSEKIRLVGYSDSLVGYKLLFENIFLIHAWGQGESLSYNQPSWSISVEFFAYLLFPILILIIRKPPVIISIILSYAFFIVLYFYCYYFFEKNLTNLTFDGGIARILPEFIFGISLYFFFREYRYIGSLSQQLSIAFFTLLLCLYLKGMDFIVVPMLVWIIYLLAEKQRQGVSCWLNNRFLVFLGKASYSLYMVHYCVWLGGLHIFLGHYMGLTYQENLPASVVYISMAAVILLMLILSIFLYKYIEVPLRHLIINKFAN